MQRIFERIILYFILHRSYVYDTMALRIQGRNGVPPGTVGAVPGKDGILGTTQYRLSPAIHAYLLYVRKPCFTSGEMEILDRGIFVFVYIEVQVYGGVL